MASPRVVLANGCFDPLHYGHVLHLRAARKLGDRLVVSVTQNTKVNKGPNRPAVDEKDRMDMLRELRCVDDVILVGGALEALYLVWPAVFVKGSDYEGSVGSAAEDFCKQHGVEIALTKERTFSSTDLLRHYDRFRQS